MLHAVIAAETAVLCRTFRSANFGLQLTKLKQRELFASDLVLAVRHLRALEEEGAEPAEDYRKAIGS